MSFTHLYLHFILFLDYTWGAFSIYLQYILVTIRFSVRLVLVRYAFLVVSSLVQVYYSHYHSVVLQTQLFIRKGQCNGTVNTFLGAFCSLIKTLVETFACISVPIPFVEFPSYVLLLFVSGLQSANYCIFNYITMNSYLITNHVHLFNLE